MFNDQFTNYQKKELKKTSNRIGLTLLITIVAETVLSFAFIFINSHTIKGHAIFHMMLAIVSLLALFLPFIILNFISDPTGQIHTLPFKKNSFSKILVSVIICMGCTYIAQIIASILQLLTKLTPPDLPHNNTASISIMAEIFAVAIVPGIVEEIVYRGIILGMFRKFGDRFAIFISALLFGLSHLNLVQFVFTFAIGLVFGFVTVKLHSLLPSIIAHTLNNLLATFISLNILSMANYNLILANALLISIVLIIVISIQDKSSLKLSKDATYPMSFGKKLQITCFSPAMLIFLILALLTFLGEVVYLCIKTIFS